MTGRRVPWVVLAVMAAGVILLFTAGVVGADPQVIWNATPSVPIGVYRVRPIDDAPLRIGELVLVRPDPANAVLYAHRGYLPAGVPLLKRIAAIGGQQVCEQEGALSIDNRLVARALPADSRGRPLIAWRGCRQLGEGEIFVLMAEVPASLDGRYFGPTPIRAVIGRATPLWTPGTR